MLEAKKGLCRHDDVKGLTVGAQCGHKGLPESEPWGSESGRRWQDGSGEPGCHGASCERRRRGLSQAWGRFQKLGKARQRILP